MIKNALAALATLSLLFSLGCSGGITPANVLAATSYSNASISGTYAFSSASGETMVGYIGTFTVDGSGNITSGNLSATYNSTALDASTFTACTVSLTGTYSIQSSGTGTATLTASPSGTSPCTISSSSIVPGTLSLALEVAQQGSMIVAVEQHGSWFSSFTAVKQ